MNDNFSAFVVKLASPHFKPDNKEIMEAHFFPWRAILQKWRDAGSISTEKRVPLDVGKGDARAVHINVLFGSTCTRRGWRQVPQQGEGDAEGRGGVGACCCSGLPGARVGLNIRA